MLYTNPEPYYLVSNTTLDDFVLGMLSLGKPIETSLVGVFDDTGRGSRRDIDLPMHRDGEYSKDLADAQGGTYVEQPGIDIVGLYCLCEGSGQCLTLLKNDERDLQIELRAHEALVFDNRAMLHGRKGPVGQRVLLRMWVRRDR